MRNIGLKISLTVIGVFLFAIAAYFLHDGFLHFVLGQFSDLPVIFESRNIASVVESRLIFTAVVAMLPLLFLFSHFILKSEKLTIFLAIVAITLLCGLVMLEFHIYSLRFMAEGQYEYIISIDDIRASLYLGIGFLLGAILSTAIFSFIFRN